MGRDLLGAAMPLIEERGVTLVGLSPSNLDDDDMVGPALPLDRRSVSALDNTVDELRERFGSDAITRASQLTRRLRPAMPTLPD